MNHSGIIDTQWCEKKVYLETPELAENLNDIFCAKVLRKWFLECSPRITSDSRQVPSGSVDSFL
jgi:hypothetical protein